MKKGTYILVLILILAMSGRTYAEKYSNKQFYLVDSLQYFQINPEDSVLIDSFLTLYHESDDPLIRLEHLSNMIEQCWNEDVWPRYNNFLLKRALRQLDEGEKAKEGDGAAIKKILASCYNNKGYYFDSQGVLDSALDSYEKARLLCESIADSSNLGFILNNIAFIYKNQGHIPLALEYFNESLKIQELSKNQKGVAVCYHNIGQIFDEQNQPKEALSYYQKSYEIKKQLDDKKGMAYTLNNMAGIFKAKANYEKAMELYKESYKYYGQIDSKLGMAISNVNIGMLLREMGKLDSAKTQMEAALIDFTYLGNKKWMSECSSMLAAVYFRLGDLKKAEDLGKQAFKLSEEIGYPNTIKMAAGGLREIYVQKGNWQEAYAFQNIFYQMRDSVQNEKNEQEAVRKTLTYEYEKEKALVQKENEKEMELEKEKRQRQFAILLILSIASASVLVLLFIIYRRLKITRKQKDIIGYQKNVIEEKHGEIQESINYAKRLQKAILPSFDDVNAHLDQNFILFQPKDVVSGDFYWFENVGDNVFLAAADCTGHGVPGAMVSVVCANALNRCVLEFGLVHPAEILDKTRELVVKTFTKRGENPGTETPSSGTIVKDGMDISLVRFQKNTGYMEWSGANNPVYIIRSANNSDQQQSDALPGNFEIIKGDRESIGYTYNFTPFTNHRIPVFQGDMMYLFSDGYADQFGGTKGRKLGYKRFREMLLEIHQKPMEEQKGILETNFQDWITQGNEEQVDDVCVIGVRL